MRKTLFVSICAVVCCTLCACESDNNIYIYGGEGDCEPGQKCNEGVVCLTFDCEKESYEPDEPEKCDCEEDEICQADGSCKPADDDDPTPEACEPACSSDEQCVDGQCLPVSECSKDSDCEDNQVCKDGQCEAAEVDPEACEPACSSDEQCVDGQCLPVSECSKDSDCEDNQVCKDGQCEAGEVVPKTCEPACASDEQCVDGQCKALYPCVTRLDCGSGQYCKSGKCQTEPAVSCSDNFQCVNDAYCEAGTCTAFGGAVVKQDVCKANSAVNMYDLETQCTWDAPETDTVVSSPIVIKTPHGSSANQIVVVSFHVNGFEAEPDSSWAAGHGCVRRKGTIRILDGNTCKELEAITVTSNGKLSSGTVVAAADYNQDGNAELVTRYEVAVNNTGTTDNYFTAYQWNGSKYNALGTVKATYQYDFGSISLARTSDGTPIAVLGSDILNLNKFKNVAHGSSNVISPISITTALDSDNELELIGVKSIYRFNGSKLSTAYENYTSYTGYSSYSGFDYKHYNYHHQAVADFGTVSGKVLDVTTLDGIPEVVLCSSGGVNIIQPVKGSKKSVTVFSASASQLGPCSVADFDGDGLPEIAAVGKTGVYMFDPGCEDAGNGCQAKGILWQNSVNNANSQYISTSGFDFDGDGAVEVLTSYDNQFYILNGKTGALLASTGRPLENKRYEWFETPVVADTDNDGSAEIVLTKALVSDKSCSKSSDCKSNKCSGKYCRCSSDSDCEDNYACKAAVQGDNAGNVCRAQTVNGEHVSGIKVVRHKKDAWAPARTIWNQYNYGISNIKDDMTLPLPNEILTNQKDPQYNSFRVNLRTGDAKGSEVKELTDITAKLGVNSVKTLGTLSGQLCNRGLGSIPSGIKATFISIVNGKTSELCSVATTESIGSGACVNVSCPATVSIVAGMKIQLTAENVSSCNKVSHIGELSL